MSSYKPEKRQAERDAFCRACNGSIKKGEEMVSWYSTRGQGMHIHLHLKCAEKIAETARGVSQD